MTVLSRSEGKRADALELGADKFLISSDKSAMDKAQSSFDLIIDTVPVKHDLNPYTPLLDIDGTLVIVGQVGPVAEVNTAPFCSVGRRIAASPIGGIRETQELLDFCARKNILPECEIIRMDEINTASSGWSVPTCIIALSSIWERLKLKTNRNENYAKKELGNSGLEVSALGLAVWGMSLDMGLPVIKTT